MRETHHALPVVVRFTHPTIFSQPQSVGAVGSQAELGNQGDMGLPSIDDTGCYAESIGLLKRLETAIKDKVTGIMNTANMRKYQSGVRLMPRNVSLYKGVI